MHELFATASRRGFFFRFHEGKKRRAAERQRGENERYDEKHNAAP